MTASFLDAQVFIAPNIISKEGCHWRQRNKTAMQPFLPPMQNAIQLSKSNALNYGPIHREAV